MTVLNQPPTATSRSPFSEVREQHRQATLAVIATSAVIASSTLTAAVLVALGIAA